MSEERDSAGLPVPEGGVQWWCRGGAGPEQPRRILALHQVCDHLLNLQPEQRPRSTHAFRNAARRHCAVRSFTLPPLEVARALGLADDVQSLLLRDADIPEAEAEAVDEELLCFLR